MPLVILEEAGPVTSNALALEWRPTKLRPRMPDQCPHCGGAPTRTRSISLTLPTRRDRFARITLELGTCKRVPPPFLSYLGLVTSIFFAVVFGLAAAFGNLVAIVPLVIAIAGIALAWRAYGWVRFARFDHRSIRLRVRRPAYARALADANGGRVV